MRMTEALARACARDAGNHSMRAHGRTRWSQDDWAEAGRTYARLWLVEVEEAEREFRDMLDERGSK